MRHLGYSSLNNFDLRHGVLWRSTHHTLVRDKLGQRLLDAFQLQLIRGIRETIKWKDILYTFVG